MPQSLHPQELQLFRSLKKTAIVLMLLFRLDKPVGECEIAGILEMDRGTIRIYLRSLARQGMVTRSHRFQGWILTAGGRQMVLGEPVDGRLKAQVSDGKPIVENPPSVIVEKPPSLPAPTAHAGTSVKNPPSMVEKPPSSAENPSSLAEIPPSLLPARPEAGAMVEKPASLAEDPSSSAENPSTRMENPSSMVENPPSAPVAAASLSLNSLNLKALAAAAKAGASAEIPRSNAENPPSSGKISRSRLSPRFRKIKKEDRTANGNGPCDPSVEANLEAFASNRARCLNS